MKQSPRRLRGVAVAILMIALSAGPLRADDPETLTHLSDSFESLVTRIRPAVVQIFTVGYGQALDPRATAEDLLSTRRSGGSGVILDPNGYIVTNGHVVEGARRVQVTLHAVSDETKGSILKPTGRKMGAQIVGIDRETDLAVLKIDAANLPFLELGDSDDLRQGQLVLAFGSPFGLENSVSMGVVSHVSRQLRPEDPMIYIQTDATINPGNSGGPLVSTQGRVIGINTFILSHAGGSEGVGFAAPSNIVRNVFNQFRASGRIRRGHIGVHTQTITPTMAAALGLSRDWGVILGDVYPGGPAHTAGLRVGDIILRLDKKPMENGRQFDVNLYRRAVGEKVTVEIQRGDEVRTFQVSIIERTDDPARFSQLVRPDENLIPNLGVLCVDLTQGVRQMLPPLRMQDGVLVAARAADAPFSRGGFRAGDVIHSINQVRVRDLSVLRQEADRLRAGDAVVCQVERNGQLTYVEFEIDL